MMLNSFSRHYKLPTAIITTMLLSTPLTAEEVTSGTMLNAGSIDQLLGKTLDGHMISDLIPDSTNRLIREFGFEMKLVPRSVELLGSETVIQRTEAHKGEASLDSDMRLANHTTGIPFPDLSLDDPQSGLKLIYNLLRTGWTGDTLDLNPMYFLVIDGKKGLQREQGWRFKRYLMTGRISAPHILNEELVKYESLINLYPQDTRGIGILTVNYTDARLADVYAYIKSIRRVRRLSSGSWADPVSATDILTDETFGANLDPTWYDSWELLEKRWILGASNSTVGPINLDSKDPKKRFPAMQLDKAPYWNYNDEYSPQEVWVLKGTPPPSHLVSHRIMYIGTAPNAPLFWANDFYDKKGELWRLMRIGFNNKIWDDGQVGPTASIVWIADVQRLHATVLYQGEDWAFNPEANPEDFTPAALPRQLN
ncbi:MAG: DUF1329 domain-containing protein [Immundisolibacteraceae bacterium]|nr:DUF1329 domain-containing protein [Immundisolibacteraceae bacterium]